MDDFDNGETLAGGLSQSDAAYDGDIEISSGSVSARRSESKPEILKPKSQVSEVQNGTWLNERLRLQGQSGSLLLAAVQDVLEASKLLPTLRRADHRGNFWRRVECILANVIRARHYRVSDVIAYHTGNNAYLLRNRDIQGRWLTGASLRRSIFILESAGLVKRTAGNWSGGGFGRAGGRSATLRSAEALDKLMIASGIHCRSIIVEAPALRSLVRLRSEKNADGQKRDLDFEWTAEHEQWVTSLDRYNRFANDHEVWIESLSPGQIRALVSRQNQKLADRTREPGYSQPEMFDTHLVRIFNDGTFDHGGRLYGAWYQNVPSHLRKGLVIDDERTVELDYSGMSVRMLYHRKGIDYEHDPYALDELVAYTIKMGQKPDQYRRSVKTLVQAMLNNQDEGKSPERAELELPFPRKFRRADVRDMILTRHSAIADQFGTGVGKRLQRVDSDIALYIIVSLMEENIFCLPIHDSFIVIKEHEARLRSIMISSYNKVLGFDPKIS